MSRVMFLLSLIAALAGSPLRQAEAAHDWAGLIAHLGDDTPLTDIDGGVGDDAGDAIRADVTHTSALFAIVDDLPKFFRLPIPPLRNTSQGPACQPTGDAILSGRRLSLLQRLLI